MREEDTSLEDELADWVQEAIDTLPAELAGRVDNVDVEVSDDEPDRPSILALYRGIPLTRRTTGYSFVLPDRITIYRRPLERLYGHDRALLRDRVQHVVRHELAHHFGISDARLREIGRY